MHSGTLKTPSFFFIPNPILPGSYRSNAAKQNPLKSRFKSLKCYDGSSPNITKSLNQPSTLRRPGPQINRVQILASEFRALTEPIDRVKRLLHYASLLEPMDESGRVEANRVSGCTTQVWLEAEIDSEGLMRFRADSDSEITKGFCFCLVWALDRASPAEVMAVEAEDLAGMNVGYAGSAHSRVNSWQNVLASMQRRTRELVEEKERGLDLDGFPSLLAKIEDIGSTGAFEETELPSSSAVLTETRW